MHTQFLKLGMLALLLNGLLWLGILSAPRSSIYAQDTCASVYTVQHGDWLLKIAREHETTLQELIELNPWLQQRFLWTIHPGEKLCLPDAPSQAGLSLESVFTYTKAIDGTPLSRANQIGRRKFLALAGQVEIRFVGSFNDLSNAMQSGPEPILIGFRNGEDGAAYRIFEVGGPKLLSTLQISPTVTATIPAGCDPIEINPALGQGNASEAELTFWLEADEGTRFPLPVTSLGVYPNRQNAFDCGINARELAFLVFPADTGREGEYRVDMRYEDDQYGPRGTWRRRVCSVRRRGRRC